MADDVCMAFMAEVMLQHHLWRLPVQFYKPKLVSHLIDESVLLIAKTLDWKKM